MFVAYLPWRESFGEALLIELRVGARSGHGSYIDNEVYARLLEEFDEFGEGSRRVPYGEKDVRHRSSRPTRTEF